MKKMRLLLLFFTFVTAVTSQMKLQTTTGTRTNGTITTGPATTGTITTGPATTGPITNGTATTGTRTTRPTTTWPTTTGTRTTRPTTTWPTTTGTTTNRTATNGTATTGPKTTGTTTNGTRTTGTTTNGTTTTGTTTNGTTTTGTTTNGTATTGRRTTELPGLNLNGKMMTLSRYGGVSFSRPHYDPPSSSTTRPYYTTTTGPWTTAPVTGGVSVCLRYLSDSISSVFTLSPSRSPLTFSTDGITYWLFFPSYGYDQLSFRPDIRFWANPATDIWTRVCLTVDSGRKVAQVFSGSNISTRKMLPAGINYVWSGEPVMDFPGFDGQLTDIQVWDYPLSYKEVFNYMMGGVYLPYRGSALSWSHISYSPRGRTLLEDNYEA